MKNLLQKWNSLSLIVRILIGLIIGAILGVAAPKATGLALLGDLFVGALRAVAPILVFVLVIASLANSKSNGNCVFKGEGACEVSNKISTIVPIVGNRERMGTLLLARFGEEFTDEDLVLAEHSTTIVGMEMLRAKQDELEEEARKKAVVQLAIGTLSYSELEAVEHIFNELEGNEGLLVASKIADKVGITRSVIVNALRKFESAGVIESRSLGMKGTHIKILNEKLIEELKKIR